MCLVFSVYDTVWKAAVSLFYRPESMTINMGLRECPDHPAESEQLVSHSAWGGAHPGPKVEVALRDGNACACKARHGILTGLWETKLPSRNQFPKQDHQILPGPPRSNGSQPRNRTSTCAGPVPASWLVTHRAVSPSRWLLPFQMGLTKCISSRNCSCFVRTHFAGAKHERG